MGAGGPWHGGQAGAEDRGGEVSGVWEGSPAPEGGWVTATRLFLDVLVPQTAQRRGSLFYHFGPKALFSQQFVTVFCVTKFHGVFLL